MEKTIEEKRAAIDKFLADNPELEELRARLKTFNAFRALRIEQNEIRHSNVLAWLLAPEESHGLGDIVLKRVLSNMLLTTDKSDIGLSAASVELMDFLDVEVLREWRHIDLLVIDRTNSIVILIENKIRSKESQGQLLKYIRTVEDDFPAFTKIPVFLTLTGKDTSEEVSNDFICYSYFDFLKILEAIYAQRAKQLTPAVVSFLENYMEILRRLTMQDEELIELCKTIYRRHREAIDLIVEYGSAGVGQQATDDILNEDGGYEILYSRPASVWFLPKTWAKVVPENGAVWSHLNKNVGVACWIEFWKNDIMLHFELSKMKEPDLRPECAKRLKEASFKLSNKALSENAIYSRFYGKAQKVTDMTDYEEVRSTIEKILAKAKEEFPCAEKVFREVFGATK